MFYERVIYRSEQSFAAKS